MDARNNPFALFSQATFGVSGIAGTFTTGVVAGLTGGSKASTKASSEYPDSSKKDSILMFIKNLSEQLANIKAPNDSVNLLPMLDAGSKDSLNSSAEGVAKVVGATMTALPYALAHTSQIPLDFSTAIQGLVASTHAEQRKNCLQPGASTLQPNDADKFSAHCQWLNHEISNISKNGTKQIDAEIKNNSFHNTAAMLSSGVSAALPMTAVTLASASLDGISSILRESSGFLESIKKESSASHAVNNIYHALSRISQSQNSLETLEALKALEKILIDSKPAIDLYNEHSVISPFVSTGLRAMTSAPFLATLHAITSATIATKLAGQPLSAESAQGTGTGPIQTAADASTILFGIQPTHFVNISTLSKRFKQWLQKIDAAIADNLKDNSEGRTIGSSANSLHLTNLSCMLEASSKSSSKFLPVRALSDLETSVLL